MKSRICLSVLLALSFPLFVTAQPTARVQFIHNSPDGTLNNVDLWIDGNQWFDNLPFREATPFSDIPAGQTINFGVGPENSHQVTDTLVNVTLTLQPHDTIIIHLNGTVSGVGYQPFVPLNLQVINQRREQPHSDPNSIDLFFLQGSTDEGTVDLRSGVKTLVKSAEMGDYSPYLTFPLADTTLRRTDETGRIVHGTYQLSLANWAWPGRTAVVLSSGFVDPSSNQNGHAFALMAVSNQGGPLMELQPIDPENYARLQFMQNTADQKIDTMDVYMDGEKILDDLAFRYASPFLDVVSTQSTTLGFAPANSQSVQDTFHSVQVKLDSAGIYVGITNGIESSTGYAPRPPFQFNMIRMNEELGTPGSVRFHVHHGTTDFPITMDLREGKDVIYNSMAFGGYSLPQTMTPTDRIFTLTSDDGTIEIMKFNAEFAKQNYDGELGILISSGFWVPAANSQGPAFGMYFASTKGGPFRLLSIAMDIDELKTSESHWKVYPNPVTHQLTISGNRSISPMAIEIYSVNGQKHQSLWNRKAGRVDVSALNPGLYFLHIRDEAGLHVHPFVKH